MWNASFKLTLFGCVISICCVGFASLDVVCDELNDCAWNVCLFTSQLLHPSGQQFITPAKSVHKYRGDCGAYVGAVEEMMCGCYRGGTVVM